MTGKAISVFTATNGLLLDLSGNAFESSLCGWADGHLELPDGATHYGYIQSGEASLGCSSGSFPVSAGMYFSIPGRGALHGSGSGFVISRKNYTGLFSVGGPIEGKGRLRYIDGCTDTLLIPPPYLGDPCLNLLHFPPGTDQTQHTHPSFRAGMVASGAGVCVTPDGEVPLYPEVIFIIHEDGLHSFKTGSEPMAVIAFHPDSDFGPTDEDHPMLNRTIVEGISAKHIGSIRTDG